MNIRKVLSTILVILWMFTIFYFSHQQGTGSSGMSKKVSNIIINIFDINNEMTQEEKEVAVEKIEPVIRKLAHYAIYIVGGILIINCAHAYGVHSKNAIIYSAIFGVAYAVSDEVHQLFINGRSGRIEDVIIDSIGIFTGITVYLFMKQVVDWAKAIKGGE